MGDEDNGQPGARPDLDQFVLQPLARHRVERAERLVHQHDLGVVGEHAGDRHALLHAAGKLVRIDVGKVLQADKLDETDRPFRVISALVRPRDFGPKPILSRTSSQGNRP